MANSDTAAAKKYASIAEVAAVQAQLYYNEMGNASEYAGQAQEYAEQAQSSADTSSQLLTQVQSLTTIASSAQDSASQSSSSAQSSASDAASSAESAGAAAQTKVDALSLKLASNNIGDGASLSGLAQGGNVQHGIKWLSPFMYGAVGDGVNDDSEAINTAITIAVSLGFGVDMRGGLWFITKTIDFTNIRFLICDATSKFFVDPTNFTSSYTALYAITFGNPDGNYNTGRCIKTTMIGTLNIQSNNRSAILNGVFIKSSQSYFGSISVTGFNGEGVKFSAAWDTVVLSIACELCGNISSYQFSIISGGDTSNCLTIGRIQSEQAYQKCVYIACIRSFIGPIHAERTYIISSSDGTSGILSGLNYINFYVNVGNTKFTQVFHDCITSGTAPDGSALAAIIPSVIFNLDFSACNCCSFNTSYISSSFGRNSTYDTVRATNWYFDSSNFTNNKITTTYISGVAYPTQKITFDGGYINNITPAFNASEITINRIDFATAPTFSNLILGNIAFNCCIWPSSATIGTTQTPSGYSVQSMVGETMAPVTFNDCHIPGTVTGAYQSHAIFNRGFIGTVNAASRAVLEFNGVQGTNFGHADTNNRGYITLNCKFTNVTAWNVPNAIYWTIGTETQRLGADSASAGQKFWCSSSTAFSWTKIY